VAGWGARRYAVGWMARERHVVENMRGDKAAGGSANKAAAIEDLLPYGMVERKEYASHVPASRYVIRARSCREVRRVRYYHTV